MEYDIFLNGKGSIILFPLYSSSNIVNFLKIILEKDLLSQFNKINYFFYNFLQFIYFLALDKLK